jgi:hypothetical protein
MASENDGNVVLKRIFGMLADKVRIYQILEETEVQRDEFVYCQIMHQIVFGENGFTKTLGHVWGMVHDPRFQEIENLMIVDRHAIFGGDARLGKQYINDDGTFTSPISDLEKYSEIVGEGRNFHNVLTHPDEKCPQRLWLERIHRGFTNIKPHSTLQCICATGKENPTTFKDMPYEIIWALIKQECPNRGFNADKTPNAYGQLMYDLIRADIIGLIHDYAETPLIDSYVYLRDNGIIKYTETESVASIDPFGLENPRVLQELDILEQALTHRATLRMTALKILKKAGLQNEIREADLTDIERDELLCLIYSHDYPDVENTDSTMYRAAIDAWEKQIKEIVKDYILSVITKDLKERETVQLNQLQLESNEAVDGLMKGTIQPINSYTEPTVEIPTEQEESEVVKYARMLEAIMGNEFKSELYLLLIEAERQKNTAIVDLLTPIFLTPDYPLDEKIFYNFIESIRIGSRSLRADRLEAIRGTKQTGMNLDPAKTTQIDEEFHSKDSPFRG